MSSECNLNNTAVPCDKENGEGWQQARLSVETTYVDAPVVLRVNGVRAGTLGNFSASIGKAKSKRVSTCRRWQQPHCAVTMCWHTKWSFL